MNIDGSGSAVFATASLTLGTKRPRVLAVYSGNAAFAFSISNTISEVISNATVSPRR